MNTYLETGISLVLIFFIFSIITYVVQEMIAVNLKYRSKMMWKAMSQLMDGIVIKGRMSLMAALPEAGAANTTDFYKHPQIKSLQRNLSKLPHYIPAANFALAVMDMVAKKAPGSKGILFDDVKAGLSAFVGSKGTLCEVLKNLVDTSTNIEELQKKIEAWFNDYMQRVTGWYQSHTVASVRIIAVLVALIFNINVIKLARMIYTDGKMRSSLVSMSESVINDSKPITQYYTSSFEKENAAKDFAFKARIDSATGEAKKAIEQERDSVMAALAKQYTDKNIAAIKSLTSSLDSTGLPLGWKANPFTCKFWKAEDPSSGWYINLLLALIGLLMGAGCISMGAPFWFDLLSKLVNVRRSGLKPGNKK